MNAVEELILFSAAVVVAALAVFTLYPLVQTAAGRGVTASQQIASRSSFCIMSVYSGSNETNIYIYGLQGTLRLEPRVYVDGMDVNVVSYGILRDRDGDGYLDARDLAYVEINAGILDGNLHRVTVWVGREVSELSVLKNGDPGNCPT